jgi:hypothetical protein
VKLVGERYEAKLTLRLDKTGKGLESADKIVSSSPELRRDLFTLSKEELAVIADDNQSFYEEKVPARQRREGGLWVLDSSPLSGYEKPSVEDGFEVMMNEIGKFLLHELV